MGLFGVRVADEDQARVVCSRQCKDARFRRLHPEAYREKARRKQARRRARLPGLGVIERLLTARELAELLGLSASTVLDWFEAGRLPGFKLGRAVRFRESEIAVWLESQRAVAPR